MVSEAPGTMNCVRDLDLGEVTYPLQSVFSYLWSVTLTSQAHWEN